VLTSVGDGRRWPDFEGDRDGGALLGGRTPRWRRRSGERRATRMADRRAARRGRPPGGLGWLRLVLTAANKAVAKWRGGGAS
jgi:hypothetical protein